MSALVAPLRTPAGDHLVGWRNASLRPLDEQFSWDTSIKGTGVVREDPLQAALWPQHSSQQHEQQPSQPQSSQPQPLQAQSSQPQHLNESNRGHPPSTAQQQAQSAEQARSLADGEAARPSASANDGMQRVQPGSSQEADAHTLLMLTRLRVS